MPGVFYPGCRAILKVVFDGFGGDDSNPTAIHVLPISASVNLNGYRMADTFSLEFDGRSFPFSPELIRAAAVEIYMFQSEGLVTNPDSYATGDNLTITGLIDDANLSAGGGDGLVFRVSGRDYTALMLDKAWPVEKRIPVGQPIDEIVQALVNDCTHFGSGATGGITHASTLKVRYIGEGDAPVAGSVAKTTTRATQTIKPKGGIKHARTNKKGIPVRSGKNYWDVIYSFCLQHGCITFVRGNEVIISKPQILSDQSRGRVRRMAYGRNLAHLEIERHMGREQVPQIVVSSYDDEARQTLEAKWPPDGSHASVAGAAKPKGAGAAVITGIGTVKEAIRRYTFPGIKDLAQLTEIAKTVYQNLGRSEAKIKFSTVDLKDLDGRDLILLRPGDPVEISFDEIKIEEMRSLSAPQREARLRQLGYSRIVSRLIANEFDRIQQFKQAYYTKDVNLKFSNEDGISIDVEAMNFISVKRDDAR